MCPDDRESDPVNREPFSGTNWRATSSPDISNVFKVQPVHSPSVSSLLINHICKAAFPF